MKKSQPRSKKKWPSSMRPLKINIFTKDRQLLSDIAFLLFLQMAVQNISDPHLILKEIIFILFGTLWLAFGT